MKELSFRVFDKVSKSMSPEFRLFGEFTLLGAVFAWLDHVRGNIDGTASLIDLNDLEVMRFTGKKDRNGQKIFEGDVLRHDHFSTPRNQYYLHHIVKWSEKYNAWFLLNATSMDEKDGSIMMFVSWADDKYCVAGDIHQNPKLLEK